MLQILEPVHGAVLNHRHGEQTEKALTIEVRGEAPLDCRLTVNGVPAARAGETFRAKVPLTARESDLVAVAEGPEGRMEHRVRVVWDCHSHPRYRFSIDDNSFFVRDLIRRRPNSLFDCFYLDILRRLHRTYGAKFVLNLFFTTPENDATLADLPDAWRGEWADNAEWLKLAFHAHAEFPNRPYQYAGAKKLGEDYDRVGAEVLRFAGEASWSPPTVIHWGMVHPAAMPALVQRGVRVLSGFFSLNTGGTYTGDDEAGAPGLWTPGCAGYDVNYFLDARRSEYLTRHDALKDFATGIVYSRCDIICNNTPVEKVVPTLEPLTRDPNTAEIMDLFTHEQYFWPFYFNYRPDHAERCEAAIRFCAERGYEPVFFHEGFLGAPE